MPELTEWESFYVIVGSSAAALTGLMFVVITLIADLETPQSGAVAAFGTPTVVHFCAALIVSAALSAPWHSITMVAAALAVCGLWGVGYTLIVVRRARRQSTYQPVFEDWLWHTVLPLAAYAALLIAAIDVPRNAERS